MRSIDTEILRRVQLMKQTQATNANPYANVSITRPKIPMVSNLRDFLERSIIKVGTDTITDTGVAVCHPKYGKDNTRVWVSYIENGTLHIKSARCAELISSYIWIDEEFTAPADSCDICFNSISERNLHGIEEYITDEEPWVFWTNNGAAYAKWLNPRVNMANVLLASENCTDISAVRAVISINSSWNFGLVVFMLINGTIFYRQLIDDIWYDAEVVSAGPGAPYNKIAAFRTWDYRVGVQALKGSTLYEIFSQFEGIGSRNEERIELRDISVNKDLITIQYHEQTFQERIELSDISIPTVYGGLYETGNANIVNAYNIETIVEDPDTHEEVSDWGIRLIVIFDKHLLASSVASNELSFTIVDSNNRVFNSRNAELGADGKTVTLTFLDFNNATGTCQIVYTKGTIESMASELVNTESFSFLPENLNPSYIPVPEVDSIWNE